MFEKHFFPESRNKNMCLSAVLTIKNGQEISCDMRDFAAETLSKNGTVADFLTDTLSDSKLLNCDLRNFAADTVSEIPYQKTALMQI